MEEDENGAVGIVPGPLQFCCELPRSSSRLRNVSKSTGDTNFRTVDLGLAVDSLGTLAFSTSRKYRRTVHLRSIRDDFGSENSIPLSVF